MTFSTPEISTSIEGLDTNPYTETINSMNEYAAATVYITNYMCKYMAPILAIYKSGDKEMPYSAAYDSQMKWFDETITEMNDRIQTSSSEDMIKSKVESNDLKSLRDEIEKTKDSYVEKMIAARNGEATGYAGGAAKEDYELLWIYKSDLEDFIKIDGNPYVEELYESLAKFKKARETESDMSIAHLRKMCNDEANKLNYITNQAIAKYRALHDKINDLSIFSGLRECSWKSMGTVYNDNVKCDYHMIELSGDSVDSESAVNPVDMGFPEETTTEADPDTMLYWLRYLGVATLANAMTPIYWSTGLITPSGPVRLPVIMFPIYVIGGSMTMVIGMGICGIMAYPLILFVNFGSIPASIVVPVNIAVDIIRKTLKSFTSKSRGKIITELSTELTAINEDIKKTEKDISEISDKITELRNIDTSKAARQELERRKNERRLK